MENHNFQWVIHYFYGHSYVTNCQRVNRGCGQMSQLQQDRGANYSARRHLEKHSSELILSNTLAGENKSLGFFVGKSDDLADIRTYL